jgi:hypothetical protein
MKRPLCNACKRNLAAVNYIKEDITHYRTRCDSCIRRGREIKTIKPRWMLNGYQKKMVCDRCSFRAKGSAQILVYHLDGNLNNSELSNLKSICLNCSVEVVRLELPWMVGDLAED